MINYGKHSINQSDIDSVVDVLKSDFITQGPKVVEFENDLKKYCNAKYAKVVSNATATLHIAYLAIGIKKGDSLDITKYFCFYSKCSFILWGRNRFC